MRYGDVDLDLLFVLERVLSRQSVSAAAEDLGLSQSATSHALQRLRDALGDPILVRAGPGMVPTERARALLPLALAALQAAGAVFESEEAFDPVQATGCFVIALGGELQVAFGGGLLSAFQAEVPGIDLRFRAVGPQAVDEGRRGLIDLAVAPDLSAFPYGGRSGELAEFVLQPLYTRRFVLAGAARSWPEPIDLPTYLDARHVIVSYEAGNRGFVDDLLHHLGHQRRVVAAASSFAAMAHMVSQSDALAVLPQELASALGPRLITHPLPFALPDLPMRMVWHPRHRAQRRHRFLRALFARTIQASAERQTCPALEGP